MADKLKHQPNNSIQKIIARKSINFENLKLVTKNPLNNEKSNIEMDKKLIVNNQKFNDDSKLNFTGSIDPYKLLSKDIIHNCVSKMDFCDVKIKVGNTIFNSSKFSLSSKSNFFKTLFTSETNDNTYILNEDSSIFVVVLAIQHDCINKIQFDSKNKNIIQEVISVCIMAIKFELINVINCCVNYFNSDIIDPTPEIMNLLYLINKEVYLSKFGRFSFLVKTDQFNLLDKSVLIDLTKYYREKRSGF